MHLYQLGPKFLLFLGFLEANADADLLDQALAFHRAGREAIVTCVCRVEIETRSTRIGQAGSDTTKRESGSYWRDGRRARVAETSLTFGQRDLLIDDQRTRIVVNNNGQLFAIVAPTPRGSDVCYCDAWCSGLFQLNKPGTLQYLELENLVKAASKVRGVRRRGDGYVIEMEFPQEAKGGAPWLVTCEVDGKHNGLISRVKYEVDIGGKRLLREDTVDQFLEPAQGISFPSATTFTAEWNGGRTVAKARFAEVAVNAPVPAERFVLAFPRGISCQNLIESTNYTADEQGNPLGPVTPRRTYAAPPAALASVSGPKGPTEESPFSWAYVGMIGSSTLIVLSGAYWLWQRRQERRAQL